MLLDFTSQNENQPFRETTVRRALSRLELHIGVCI